MNKIIILLSLMISIKAYSGCEEKVFEYINASNGEQAWVYLNSQCNEILVKDEFGEEENIRGKFLSVSQRFIMNIDKCNSYASSQSWKTHLNLKKCIDDKAVKFYNKRFVDPIKPLLGNWKSKYQVARKTKSKKDKTRKSVAQKKLQKKKVKQNVAKQKLSVVEKNIKAYLKADYEISGRKVFNYCGMLKVVERQNDNVKDMVKKGAPQSVVNEEGVDLQKFAYEAKGMISILEKKYGKFNPQTLCSKPFKNIQKIHDQVKNWQ